MVIPTTMKRQRQIVIFCIVLLAITVAIVGVHNRLLARALFRRHQCFVNFCFLGKHLAMYSMDHGGAYPPNLQNLRPEEPAEGHDAVYYHRFLRCPAAHRPSRSSNMDELRDDYVYVSGLLNSDSSDGVIAFCPPHNHRPRGIFRWWRYSLRRSAVHNLDDVTVLHLDGSVRYYSPREFTALTNNPSAFFGATDEYILSGMQNRTTLIWPQHHNKEDQQSL